MNRYQLQQKLIDYGYALGETETRANSGDPDFLVSLNKAIILSHELGKDIYPFRKKVLSTGLERSIHNLLKEAKDQAQKKDPNYQTQIAMAQVYAEEVGTDIKQIVEDIEKYYYA